MHKLMQDNIYHWCLTIPAQNGTVMLQKEIAGKNIWYVLVTFKPSEGPSLDVILGEEFTRRYPTCIFQTKGIVMSTSTSPLLRSPTGSCARPRRPIGSKRSSSRLSRVTMHVCNRNVCLDAISTDRVITMIRGEWRIAHSFPCSKEFRSEPIGDTVLGKRKGM